MQTQRLQPYFSDYASHHRTMGNQICHAIGIPLIAMSLMGLLSTYSYILIAGAAAWYLYLDWKIGLPFIGVALGLYWMGISIPTTPLWIIFVAGWIIQFVGHHFYEKNQPAFTKNLLHLLIGPLWLFAKAIRYA
jgi:uncharacterized membrane protein YGL010W